MGPQPRSTITPNCALAKIKHVEDFDFARSPRGRTNNFRDVFLTICEGWDFARSPRGRNINFRDECFSNSTYFHNLQHRSGLGNSTPWSASSRRCDHTNSRQIPAYVALFREKSLICSKILHFRLPTEELRPRERSHEFRAGRLV